MSENDTFYNNLVGGSGTATATPTPPKPNTEGAKATGQQVFGPNGEILTIQTGAGPEANKAWLYNPETGERFPVPQGGITAITTDQRMVQLSYRGEILGEPTKLTQTQFDNYLKYGSLTAPEEEEAGSGPSIYGTRAPDPGGAIDALWTKYDMMLKDANIPNENAKNWLAAELQKIEAQALYEVNQATIDQNAAVENNRAQGDFDTLTADIAASKETGLRSREIARAERGVRIQEERGSRANTALDLLKTSLPNTAAMNIPLLGNMPLPQVQPDEFLDIAGLNNIPDISPNLGADFGTPTQPMNVPNPQLTPVNAGALPPGYAPIAQPPLPELDELIKSVISGFQGWQM
jgi:hypothetical protein